MAAITNNCVMMTEQEWDAAAFFLSFCPLLLYLCTPFEREGGRRKAKLNKYTSSEWRERGRVGNEVRDGNESKCALPGTQRERWREGGRESNAKSTKRSSLDPRPATFLYVFGHFHIFDHEVDNLETSLLLGNADDDDDDTPWATANLEDYIPRDGHLSALKNQTVGASRF